MILPGAGIGASSATAPETKKSNYNTVEQDMTEYAACKEAAEIAEKQVAMLRRVMQAKDPLHPETRQLVHEFSKALADKLAKAEQKYGYRDNWRTDDWESDCRAELMRHIEKGDPLDVAAYCAFMWRRGWSTNCT